MQNTIGTISLFSFGCIDTNNLYVRVRITANSVVYDWTFFLNRLEHLRQLSGVLEVLRLDRIDELNNTPIIVYTDNNALRALGSCDGMVYLTI